MQIADHTICFDSMNMIECVQLETSHWNTVREGVWIADLDLHDSKVVAHTLAGTPSKGDPALVQPRLSFLCHPPGQPNTHESTHYSGRI